MFRTLGDRDVEQMYLIVAACQVAGRCISETGCRSPSLALGFALYRDGPTNQPYPGSRCGSREKLLDRPRARWLRHTQSVSLCRAHEGEVLRKDDELDPRGDGGVDQVLGLGEISSDVSAAGHLDSGNFQPAPSPVAVGLTMAAAGSALSPASSSSAVAMSPRRT